MTGSSPYVSTRTRWLTIAVCATMLICFYLLSFFANSTKSATYDEPLHFVSSFAAYHYGDFRCDLEDPPLWKYIAVLGTRWQDMTLDLQGDQAKRMLDEQEAESLFSVETLYLHNDADALLLPAHGRMVLIAIALATLMAAWSWKLGGSVAAIASTAMFCFDPNFMAHAPLVKNDVAISLAVLWLAYSVWRVGRKITVVWIIASCTALGLALATKFTGVLMIPVLAILLFSRAMLPQTWPALGRQLTRRRQRLFAAAGLFAGAMVAGWVIIWASYGFHFGPMRGSDALLSDSQEIKTAAVEEQLLREHSPTLTFEGLQRTQIATETPGPMSWKVKGMVFVERHRLLPQSWIVGLLFTYAHSMVRPAFLMDQHSMFGFWYYFPLAMLFKTPLATLAAIVLAPVALFIKKNHETSTPIAQRDWLWPAICLVIPPSFYMASAMSSHMNLGIRHVLLVYPFLFIGIALAAKAASQWRPSTMWTIGGILLVGLILENVAACPNYLAFFNTASGGSSGGLHLLSDSNLDWGQDLPRLRDWQKAHANQPIALCFFGQAYPKYYGIHYVNQPGSNAGRDLPDMPPGDAYLVISATQLQGTYLIDEHRAFYAQLKDQQPIDVLGGSIYIFKIKAKLPGDELK